MVQLMITIFQNKVQRGLFFLSPIQRSFFNLGQIISLNNNIVGKYGGK